MSTMSNCSLVDLATFIVVGIFGAVVTEKALFFTAMRCCRVASDARGLDGEDLRNHEETHYGLRPH